MSIDARLFGIGLLGLISIAGPLQAEGPLSAIDWLSKSVTAPGAAPSTASQPSAAPVTTPTVDVTVLRNSSLDGLGLRPASVTGLPADIWGQTPTAELATLLAHVWVSDLPALQGLFYTLLLAETDPPFDDTGSGTLFLARIDKLLDLGALDQAQALLELSGNREPDLFRRWFDIALLLGQEDRACKVMRELPSVAPTLPARIFCLSRTGDWGAASLTLDTGRALGMLSAEDDAILSRFLDEDTADSGQDLPPPTRPSPLIWRMMEAIGQPLPTNMLPLAFAQADLRSNTGWKAQIEAVERLARTGAVPAGRLLSIYESGKPSASGGVWDRVAAVQALDAALSGRDPLAVARALKPAWSAMADAGLEVPFADLFASPLARVHLTGDAAALAFRIGLLSQSYAALAIGKPPKDPTDAYLFALANGIPGSVPAPTPLGSAIAAAFANPAPITPDFSRLLDAHREGEVVLKAMMRVVDGAAGDLRGVTGGLAALRRVGFEDVARKTGLQLMLLGRKG